MDEILPGTLMYSRHGMSRLKMSPSLTPPMLAFTSVYFSGISLFNRLRPFGVKKFLSRLKLPVRVSQTLSHPSSLPRAALDGSCDPINRRKHNAIFCFCQGIVDSYSDSCWGREKPESWGRGLKASSRPGWPRPSTRSARRMPARKCGDGKLSCCKPSVPAERNVGLVFGAYDVDGGGQPGGDDKGPTTGGSPLP